MKSYWERDMDFQCRRNWCGFLAGAAEYIIAIGCIAVIGLFLVAVFVG